MERKRIGLGALALATALIASGCDRNPKIVDCNSENKTAEQNYTLPLDGYIWLAGIEFKPNDNGKITVYSQNVSVRVEPEGSEPTADVPGIVTVHSDNSMTYVSEDIIYTVKGEKSEYNSTTINVKETCLPINTP